MAQSVQIIKCNRVGIEFSQWVGKPARISAGPVLGEIVRAYSRKGIRSLKKSAKKSDVLTHLQE